MPLFGKKEEEARLPRHIAIIMDGNGRWAKRRFLPRSAGHRAGAKTFQDIARYANQIGVGYMTVYAFSTENWKRPKEEIDNLMNLMRDYLKDAKNFKEENIQVQFIGDLSVLPQDMQELIREDEELSADATGMHLNIAVNYGGRDEILRAVRQLAAEAKAGELDPATIDEALFSARLYTAGQPDPDLIIRPSGEFRLSNYLIWQSAYAEFWFSDILWPDFNRKHLMQAIEAYNSRSRRFGGV